MSRLTQGNIKIVTARYVDVNGEISENSTLFYFHKDNEGYLYSKLKYTKTEVILYIPYIKYDNRIFLYSQKPNCKIAEDNINVAVMTDLMYVASNEELRVLKAWTTRYGKPTKSKFIV